MFQNLLEYEKTNYDENIKSNLKISSFFDKKIEDSNTILLVASNKASVVGYIYGYVDLDNKIKEYLEAYISSIYVIENYRNKKIGTKLIEEFIKVCNEQSIKYINIDNFIDNKIAKNLYEKLDFTVVKETRRRKIN